MTVLNLLLYSLADNILFVCFCSSNLTVWLWILYLWQQNSKQSYAAHWRCVQYFILRMKKKKSLLIDLICEPEHLRHNVKGTGFEARHLRFKSKFHHLQAKWYWTSVWACYLTCEKYAPYRVWWGLEVRVTGCWMVDKAGKNGWCILRDLRRSVC